MKSEDTLKNREETTINPLNWYFLQHKPCAMYIPAAILISLLKCLFRALGFKCKHLGFSSYISGLFRVLYAFQMKTSTICSHTQYVCLLPLNTASSFSFHFIAVLKVTIYTHLQMIPFLFTRPDVYQWEAYPFSMTLVGK